MADSEFDEYEAFTKRMEEKFPKMFANPYGGFAVSKGWYPILEKLCDNIQAHIDWKNEQHCRYNQGGVRQVTVAQIKEKFGGLRFYYDGGDDEIRGMVRMAESWASIACEQCGNVGKRRGGAGAWILSLIHI
jgi:hypothetical protein